MRGCRAERDGSVTLRSPLRYRPGPRTTSGATFHTIRAISLRSITPSSGPSGHLPPQGGKGFTTLADALAVTPPLHDADFDVEQVEHPSDGVIDHIGQVRRTSVKRGNRRGDDGAPLRQRPPGTQMTH